jgi:hypothetical protein
MVAHLRDTPPAVTSINPLIPSFLESIITRALAKEPRERPASMGDLVTELDSYVASASRPTIRPPTGKHSTTLGAASGEVRGRRTQADGGRSKTTWALISVAALGVGVGGAWWLARHDSAPAPVLPAASVVTAPAPAAPAKIKLAISSDPEGAQVFRAADGVLLGTTPTVVWLEPTEGRVPFLMKLDGFAEERFDLHADKNGAANIALRPLPLAPDKPDKPDKPRAKRSGSSAAKAAPVAAPMVPAAAPPPQVKPEPAKAEAPRTEPRKRAPVVLDP